MAIGMTEPVPQLSIVIPAYNEASRLPSTLEAVVRHLSACPDPWEVIVVDDGSRDATADAADAYARSHPGVRVLRNGGNRGKGYSVRNGMLEARGRFRIFSDADLSTPIPESRKILHALERGAGVAAASRRLGASRIEGRQPWYREAMGRSFNLVVQVLAVRGVSDTQCGFKGFTAEAARAIFPRARIDRFGFDVEILFLARKLGFPIAEVPVRWIDNPDSRVNPLRDPWRMFLEVVRVRRNDWEGLYRKA
jgi:dolichyl-phosphate beta-glucosyltransferase